VLLVLMLVATYPWRVDHERVLCEVVWDPNANDILYISRARDLASVMIRTATLLGRDGDITIFVEE